MKSDFKSDVLKNSNRLPKTTKREMIMDIAAAERREKRGKSHNSNFVFVKSKEWRVKLLLKGKLELTTLWFLSSRSFANESVIDENFEQKIK